MYKYISGLTSAGLLENCVSPSQNRDDRNKGSRHDFGRTDADQGNYYVGRSDGANDDCAIVLEIDRGREVHCR